MTIQEAWAAMLDVPLEVVWDAAVAFTVGMVIVLAVVITLLLFLTD